MDQNSSTDKNVKSDPIALLRLTKHLIKDLSKEHSNITDVEEILLKGNITDLRQKIRDACLNLLQHDKFRRESIDIMWTNCFYEPIRLYKSVGDLDEEDRLHIKQFISASISSISLLLDQFVDMRPTLFTHLGDLHRYSYTTVEQNIQHLTAAAECYKKALRLDPKNGHPFNQLALLLKEHNLEHSLSLFLRACIVPKPFSHALKNLRALKKNKFEHNSSLSLFNLVDILIYDFGRVSFEDERKRFDRLFEELLKQSHHLSAVRLIHSFALASIYTLLNEEDDEKFRCSVSFLFRKWAFLLVEVEKHLEEHTLKEDEQQLAKKRRQKRKSSSSSESSEENSEFKNGTAGEESQIGADFAWVLLSSIFEFLNFTDGRFTGRKLSVSLKFQFQNLLKTLVDILNELLPKLSPKMQKNEDNEMETMEQIAEWSINGPFTEGNDEEQCEIAASFIRHVVKKQKIAIVFDKFFQMSSNLMEEKELKPIEAFSKMHLQHVTNENEKTSKVPVYVAPDSSVFLHKLDLVKHLLLSMNQTVIIARSVLSRLDKVKRENNNAREAIRWIQSRIPEGRVRMLPHTGEKFTNECLQFVREKGLLDKKTLFCSILTTEEASGEYERQKEEMRQFNSVSVEDIGDFITRIVRINANT
ncbi:hypothetical protein niasHT_024142 [Heterodera trifolii]|uniref:Uncharacterized protein n=1 Tax=Heterodera trifolii TaxID=157864 RepID=A0ABD2JLQ2_9BILA